MKTKTTQTQTQTQTETQRAAAVAAIDLECADILGTGWLVRTLLDAARTDAPMLPASSRELFAQSELCLTRGALVASAYLLTEAIEAAIAQR